MRAAIYARKSTDDSDRNAENKSVERQVDTAKAYAESKGWTVDSAHVYIDDAISGAEFKNRPALLRLLDHLKDFDVIVTSELSRLGREQTQTASVLAGIYAKGRRVFFYLTDEEVKFDSAIDKFLVGAVSFAAEVEREKASQRARDALARKAVRGYNTGGIVYGYDNVVIEATNAAGERVRSHTEYRINEEQAATIRAIFEMYTAGHGLLIIARTMNGDERYTQYSYDFFNGVTPPSPRKGTGSWAPSSIRAILHNVRYTGKVPFGKHRKVYKGGTKARVKQDTFDLIDAPHLRIIPVELWDAAQAQLRAMRTAYLDATGGESFGRPDSGRESKYLLSGIARCGICGGNLIAMTGGAHAKISRYLCSYNHNRGATVCANDHREHVDRLDGPVLAAIEETVLTPATIDYVIERALALATERPSSDRDKERTLTAEHRKIKKGLDNLIALAAAGDAPVSILVEIRNREQRLAAVEAELAEVSTPAVDNVDLDGRRLKKALRDRLGEFRDLLRGNVPTARQALRKLLTGPLRVTPIIRDGRKTFRFVGETSLGALVDQGFIKMASPRGFEPLLPP